MSKTKFISAWGPTVKVVGDNYECAMNDWLKLLKPDSYSEFNPTIYKENGGFTLFALIHFEIKDEDKEPCPDSEISSKAKLFMDTRPVADILYEDLANGSNGFGTRVLNYILGRGNMKASMVPKSLIHLVQMDRGKLLKYKHVGRQTVDCLEQVLEEKGLRLGMTPQEVGLIVNG